MFPYHDENATQRTPIVTIALCSGGSGHRSLVALLANVCCVAGVLMPLASHAEEKRVLVGEHTLRMRIEGTGAPAVVFEAGRGGRLDDWSEVQAEVAKFARTVTYDRAGSGQSSPGPKPRDARRIASELREGLKKAGVHPPYVLVGHSQGAFYIRVFAHAYSNEVAGLVFVDPTTENFLDWLKATVPDAEKMGEREMGPYPSDGQRGEWEARDLTDEQTRQAWPLPKVPAVVLTAARAEPTRPAQFLKAWLSSQEEWLRKLPSPKHVITDRSGHNIQREEPELIVRAIREVIEQRPAR